jgi:hypothetical protein
MRGKNIFLNVKDETSAASKGKRKGRSLNLVKQRNQCLIARYYYYSAFTDKRFDLVLEQLGLEFFLSAYTISDIVEKNMSQLQELKKEKPALLYFQQMWGHLRW